MHSAPQIWHVAQALLANHVVQVILLASTIVSTMQQGRAVLKFCWKAVLALSALAEVGVTLIVRPQRLLEGLFESLIPSTPAVDAKWLGYLSIFAIGFGAALLFCCRCSRRLTA